MATPEHCATDCRSTDGETVGLIDAAIIILRMASRRSLVSVEVQAALADLRADREVWALVDDGRPGV